MKAVLISIHPKWCELIASGKKTIEVRKTAPKIQTPFKCFIYETQGKTETPWMDEEGHMIFRGRGMVIGEFICDKISIFRPKSITCDHHIKKASCVSLSELIEYANTKNEHISAWNISNLVIYDKPKPLSEFTRHDNSYNNSFGWVFEDRKKEIPIQRPPQSWCYVED